MSDEKTVDIGLGLQDFLAPPAAPAEEQAADAPKEEPPKEEAPKEAPPATEPAKEEPPKEEPKQEEPPKEAKPDWDAKDNPWRKRAQKLEKQHRDMRDWATRINSDNEQLRRRIDSLVSKLDSEGVETPPAAKAVSDEPSPEQIRQQAALQGKVEASRAAAYRLYGKEQVDALVFDEDAPFREYDTDLGVQQRVLAAEAPVLEALRFLDELKLREKYGDLDPVAIEKKIRAEVEKELREKITQEMSKQLQDRIAKKDKQIAGVGDAPGTGDRDRKDQPTPGVRPLSEIVNPALS